MSAKYEQYLHNKVSKNSMNAKAAGIRLSSPVVRTDDHNFRASKQKFSARATPAVVEKPGSTRFRSAIRTARNYQRDHSIISNESRLSGTNVSYMSNISNIKQNIMRFKYKPKRVQIVNVGRSTELKHVEIKPKTQSKHLSFMNTPQSKKQHSLLQNTGGLQLGYLTNRQTEKTSFSVNRKQIKAPSAFSARNTMMAPQHNFNRT